MSQGGTSKETKSCCSTLAPRNRQLNSTAGQWKDAPPDIGLEPESHLGDCPAKGCLVLVWCELPATSIVALMEMEKAQFCDLFLEVS